jgi:hypothetical protein
MHSIVGTAATPSSNCQVPPAGHATARRCVRSRISRRAPGDGHWADDRPAPRPPLEKVGKTPIPRLLSKRVPRLTSNAEVSLESHSPASGESPIFGLSTQPSRLCRRMVPHMGRRERHHQSCGPEAFWRVKKAMQRAFQQARLLRLTRSCVLIASQS